MAPLLEHQDLLQRVGRIEAAADRADLDELRRELDDLVEVFAAHTDHERPALWRLPTFTERLLRRGQERLLDELTALAVEAEGLDGPVDCVRLSRQVAADLVFQIDAETRAFARVA